MPALHFSFLWGIKSLWAFWVFCFWFTMKSLHFGWQKFVDDTDLETWLIGIFLSMWNERSLDVVSTERGRCLTGSRLHGKTSLWQRWWARLQVGLCKDGLVAFLTCVDEQTHQRADQFQGQDAQNEVKIQPAGLGEGVLHAQDQEKHRAAWERGPEARC